MKTILGTGQLGLAILHLLLDKNPLEKILRADFYPATANALAGKQITYPSDIVKATVDSYLSTQKNK